MNYIPTTWKAGDVITQEKLNNAEQGVAGVASILPDLPSEDGEYELKCKMREGEVQTYWKKIPDAKLCLTFSSVAPFSLSVLDYSPNWDGTLEFSLDLNTWQEWDGTFELFCSSHNKLYLRGTGNTTMVNIADWGITNFVLDSTSGVQCTGNIETLLDYQTVVNGEHPVMEEGCFVGLFMNCTSLTTAPELPATTLALGCYQEMFSGCESLLAAPELPATTLAEACYDSMFSGCTSLTTAPELPATTLAESCYDGMFYRCASLTIPPELPATTLADYCYQDMFSECGIKLSTVEEGEYTIPYRIPTTGEGIDATDALTGMFENTGGDFSGTPEINTTYYVSSGSTVEEA